MGIGVAVTLRDNFTNRANAVSASMGRMHNNVRRVIADNLRAVRNLSLGVATAGALMLGPLTSAVKAGSEFNYIMAAVGAVTQDTIVGLDKLHNQALDISRETIHTANEIGDAMKFLGMAGFNTKQIAESIRAVSYLGAATDTMIGGIGGGADIMSNVMQQFNIDAKQSMRVADLLVATTTRANTNLTQLGEAVYYAGGQFSALQVPMEEVLAMAGVIAGAGYRGSFAGTAMMNMAQQLVKALGEFRTGRQSKVLEKIGLTAKDVMVMKDGIVYLKSMPDVFDALGSKIDKGVIGASQIDALFRKRGARAFVAAMRDPKVGMNLREFTKFLKTETTGKAFEISEKRLGNHYGQMKILQSAWNTFRITVAEALFPVLLPLIKVLTSVANVLIKITSNPVGKWLTVFAVGAWAVVTVGAALLFVFSSISLLAMKSTVTFANMGRSLVWAWNSAAAAATRYMLVQKGVGNNMVMNSAGRWIDRSTGRYIKAPAVGGGGITGVFASFGKWITKLVPALKNLVPLLGRFASVVTGPIGWIATILIALVGFKNMVKGVVYALGSLVQGIFYLYDVITGIGGNLLSPWNWGESMDDANKKFEKRQEKLLKWLDFDTGTSAPVTRGKKYTQEFADDLARQWQNLQVEVAARKLDISQAEASRRQAEGTLNIKSVIQMDGKAVAESTTEYDDMELARLLQSN